LSPDGARWVACRPGFFLPVRVLSRLFRRLFIEKLQAAFDAGRLAFFGALARLADTAAFTQCLAELRRVEWVVYAKRPFADPAAVLAYLGRYTHRVAIANSRLVALAGGQVSFRWRDYRHHDKNKIMTLAAGEFIRRFLLHALPAGFHRIRHYGFLANRHRADKLALCRTLLAVADADVALGDSQERQRYADRAPDTCPCCGGHMEPIGSLPRARPVLTNDHRVDAPGRDSDSGDELSAPRAPPAHGCRCPRWVTTALARAPGSGQPGSAAHRSHPADRRSDRCARDRRIQFPIVRAAARGLAQSGFQRDRIPPCGGSACATRSRRNLRDYHVDSLLEAPWSRRTWG
jgi:hypothetical protein